MQKLKGSEEWNQTRQFLTYHEICLLHGCISGYMHMIEHDVVVMGKHCQEITGDKAVSTAKA